MIDTLRADFPTDMTRAADGAPMGTMEHIAADAVERVTEYAKSNPLAFGLWAMGVGFVLGWKLKPW